jgi:transcriptional regulator with XRE-family HTH domain
MKKKRHTQKSMSEAIGISQTAFGDILKRQDLKVSLLEKIAEVLEVPVGSFFPEEGSTITNTGNNNINQNAQGKDISQTISENKSLRNEVKRLNDDNKHLKEQNQFLMQELEFVRKLFEESKDLNKE